MTTSFRDLINKLNGMSEIKKPLNESIMEDEMDMDTVHSDEDLTEENPESLPFSDNKNATMSGIMNSLGSDEDETSDLSDTQEEPEEISGEENNSSSDIRSNPLIKQLLTGGAASLNLSQRKQALDMLKDYLTSEKTTESISEGKEVKKETKVKKLKKEEIPTKKKPKK